MTAEPISFADLRKRILEENNLKRLGDSDVDPHLSGLDERLGQLAQLLQREGDTFVVPYLTLTRQTIKLLLLKHAVQGRDKINFSFTIDPTDSGFPTSKDFYTLKLDKDAAQQALELLGSRDQIIDRVRDAVFLGQNPFSPQVQLKRFNYYSQINGADIFEEFMPGTPVLVGEEKGTRRYTLEWRCLERGTNLPVFYRMCLDQDSWGEPLHEAKNDALATFLFHSQYGSLSVRSFISQVDRGFTDLHPKLLEKYVIGPFYNSQTQNSEEIDRLLAIEPGSPILKFSRESIMSSSSREADTTFWQRLMGRINKQEVYGPTDIERRMIVPFRTKQHLGNYDEKGNPCKVYAVTQEGEVIGK